MWSYALRQHVVSSGTEGVRSKEDAQRRTQAVSILYVISIVVIISVGITSTVLHGLTETKGDTVHVLDGGWVDGVAWAECFKFTLPVNGLSSRRSGEGKNGVVYKSC
jgi:hypothetical protein